MTESLPQSDAAPMLRIEISPEPTEDERDALVAALAVMVSAPLVATANPSVASPPTTLGSWARAGREAAFAARDLRMRRSR